jgi:hypothetical protein
MLALYVTVEPDAGEMTLDRLTAVFAQVRAIWEPYGFAICVSSLITVDCEPREVWARVIIGDSRPRPAPDTIGWIAFHASGVPDNVIYVSPAGTRRALARGRVNAEPLATAPAPVRERFVRQSMGRTIAHELGHYLLGSKQHVARGLMRASLPVSDLLTPGLTRFQLEAEHLPLLDDRMQRLLATRSAEPGVPRDLSGALARLVLPQ